MKSICADLAAEYQALDDLAAGLDKNQWFLETRFFNWTVFDELAHIAFFDHEALLAIDDPVGFKTRARVIMKIVLSEDNWPSHFNPMLGITGPNELLVFWRDTRSRLVQRLQGMAPETALPWYGPDMRAHAFAAARLMETWAHGQDIFDVLHQKRTHFPRLYHVAHLGVITCKWSFTVHGLPPPDIHPRVVLTGPGKKIWEWGEPGAPDQVRGSAEDFCLVVTQRRHVADTDLKWRGRHVEDWLAMAQAFAGIPQYPPKPGVRAMAYNKKGGNHV